MNDPAVNDPPASRGPGGPVAGTGGPWVEAADAQDDVPVDPARWARLATEVLVAEGVTADAECGLHFVDEATIAALNLEHLGGEGPTDVLAFPLDGPGTADGSEAPASGVAPVLVGDVVVCPAVAARNAASHARALEDELALLVVHGLLHLLGHDHAEHADRAVMVARERDLLGRFHQEEELSR